jgi:hypothetical protein
MKKEAVGHAHLPYIHLDFLYRELDRVTHA